MNTLQRPMAVGVVVCRALSGDRAPVQAAEKTEDSRTSFESVPPGVDDRTTPQFDDVALTMTAYVGDRSCAQVHSSHAAQWRYVGQDAFGARTRIAGGSAFNTSDNRHCLTRQGSAPDSMLRLI